MSSSNYHVTANKFVGVLSRYTRILLSYGTESGSKIRVFNLTTSIDNEILIGISNDLLSSTTCTFIFTIFHFNGYCMKHNS